MLTWPQNTLNYTCTCTDGSSPNISAYQQTIPFYECQQWKTDCVAAHPNDLDGQTGCLSVTCGNLNASSGESSTSSSMASTATASSTGSSAASSASATGSSTGSSTASSASATSSSAAVAMSVAKNYGTGILAAAMLAVFGLAL
jgi:hypothetical protein